MFWHPLFSFTSSVAAPPAIVVQSSGGDTAVGTMGGTFGPIPLEMPPDLYDEGEELELAELATLIIRMLA